MEAGEKILFGGKVNCRIISENHYVKTVGDLRLKLLEFVYGHATLNGPISSGLGS